MLLRCRLNLVSVFINTHHASVLMPLWRGEFVECTTIVSCQLDFVCHVWIRVSAIFADEQTALCPVMMLIPIFMTQLVDGRQMFVVTTAENECCKNETCDLHDSSENTVNGYGRTQTDGSGDSGT